jgi:hypothetical protein
MGTPSSTVSVSSTQPQVAYLAEGKLYLATPGSKPDLVESHFAQEILDRQERNRQRHEWKQSGMAWNFNRMPGLPVPNASARSIRLTCLARAGADELAYALETDAVGGLFFWERKTGCERRLFHRAEFHANDLSIHPADGTIAVSVRMEDGAVNVALMKSDGKGMRVVTAGDSTDECPAWLPPDAPGVVGKKVLVYQSAGLARGSQGMVAERGPYAVLQLDTDDGEMKTLLESDDHDYLSPRVGPGGSLYYIERPYQPLHAPVSPWKVALNILLFPFGLFMAIVHFFDWFSIVFRRKPLITAGGPRREGPEERYMMLWGKMVDAEKLHREAAGASAPKALVPRTWQLKRRGLSGPDEAIATHVVSYDLYPDGGVVYTNGATIYHVAPTGARTEVSTGRLIERVVAM